MNNCSVKVEAHDKITQAKGTKRYANCPKYSDVQLLNERQSAGVLPTETEREKISPITYTCILTFNSGVLRRN